MTQFIHRACTVLCAGVLSATALPAMAQEPPQTWTARDEQNPWIDDPRMHEFYQATVEAFADGPDDVDQAAYESRSREIFTRFAIANDMPVEGMLDHLEAIPGQMIDNARRDPEILASYDAFVEALFGPQSFPADAPTVGGAE